MAPAPRDRRLRAAAALVVALTVAAYAGSLTNGFVGWDDPQLVTGNATVRAFDWRGIATDFTQSTWHPLTLWTYAVEHRLFGLEPAAFHATNLALHATSAVLVLLLAARLLPGGVVGPAAAALLFALHPLHVESVAWVAERKDVLSTCLYLGAVLAHVRSDRAEARPAWSTTLLFALALLSKPTAVTLPVVLVVVDALRTRRVTARTVTSKALLLLGSVAVGLVNLRGQATAAIVEAEPARLDRALGDAWDSLLFYVDRTVRPVGLSVYYDERALAVGLPEAATTAGVVLLLVLYARRRPERRALVLAGAAWFAVTIALVLKLVPFGERSLVNDRYTYLPHVGLFLVAGAAAGDAWNAARRAGVAARTAAVAVAAVLTLALAVASHRRAAVWRDDGTLWRDVLATYPDTPKAHEYLAFHLAEQGDGPGALAHMEEAARLEPESASLHLNLGALYGNLGRHAEARAAFERCVRADPDSVEAHTNLGLALARAGELGPAEQHLRRAAELAPGYPPALLPLARLVARRGAQAEAVALLERALQSAPWSPELHAELVGRLLAAGRGDEARERADRARRAGVALPSELLAALGAD